MTNPSDSNQSLTLDHTAGALLPPPPIRRIDLATLDDVRLELASVYRDMKAGRIDPTDGTKLTYVLSQIGKQITDGNLADRLELIELTLNQRKK